MNYSQVSRKIIKGSILMRAKLLNNGINTFWWAKTKNFGDLLTPEIFNTYGYTSINTSADTADIIAVGSLIEMLPQDYKGIILGTGLMYDKPRELPAAQFVSVRGELTKSNLQLSKETLTGDLGLLAKVLILKPNKKYTIGLIPHYVDKQHPWIKTIKNFLGSKGYVIDVQDSAKNVTKNISMCELIISSSLHGIIVADSLNIPNVWIELSDKVAGAGFKFWDYNSSIDYEQPPLKVNSLTSMTNVEAMISQKNYKSINNKCHELEKIIRSTLASTK